MHPRLGSSASPGSNGPQRRYLLPVAAGAPSVTNLDIDDGSCAPAPLVLPGVGGNGGGICRTPSMRNPSNVAVGPTPFQSPMAPYRRSTPPLPAANHRQSQAGVGRLPGDGNVNATGGMAPPPTVALASAIMHELNARQSEPRCWCGRAGCERPAG
ncbi:hypothetical protein Vretimale_3135 [Volvox reticuliferus]|uniref:Uncharacterized protein n=1 Tax=Volvox reticuliferus TaxID=1737510 RepID=A0A8J4D846_9CHLO|nr:hypothetical protein Vretimale_3135 [Volvox reticuliferus]